MRINIARTPGVVCRSVILPRCQTCVQQADIRSCTLHGHHSPKHTCTAQLDCMHHTGIRRSDVQGMNPVGKLLTLVSSFLSCLYPDMRSDSAGLTFYYRVSLLATPACGQTTLTLPFYPIAATASSSERP